MDNRRTTTGLPDLARAAPRKRIPLLSLLGAALAAAGQLLVFGPTLALAQDGKPHESASAATGLGEDRPAAVSPRHELPHFGISTAGINLRSGPGSDAPPIGVVAKGTRMRWFERQGDWLRVDALGQRGWVHGKYVHNAEPTSSPAASVGTPLEPEGSSPANTSRLPAGDATTDFDVTIEAEQLELLRRQVIAIDVLASEPLPLPRYRITHTVNFRRSPDLAGDLIGQLIPGTEFQALQRVEAWLLADIGGNRGWVHSDFARIVSRASVEARRQRLATEISALASTVTTLGRPEEPTPASTDPPTAPYQGQASDAPPADAAGTSAAPTERQSTAHDAPSFAEDTLDAEHRLTVDGLNVEIERLQSERDYAREQALGLTAELQRVDAEKQQLQNSIALLNEAESKRREKRASTELQLEALEADVGQAVQQLQQFEQQSTELRRTNADLSNRLESTEAQLRALQQEQADAGHGDSAKDRQIAELSAQIHDFATRLAVADGRSSGLQDELLAALERERDKDRTVAELTYDNGRLSTEQLALQERVEQLESHARSRQADNTTLRTQQTDLQSANEKSGRALATLNQHNAELETQLQALTADLAQRQQRVDELERAGEMAKSQAAQRAATIADLEARIENLTRVGNDKQRELQSTSEQLASTVSELNTLQTRHAVQSEGNRKLEDDLAAAHQRLRDLDADLAMLDQQHDHASAQLEGRDTEIERLSSSIAATESERDKMRKAFEAAEARSLDLQERLATAQFETNRKLENDLDAAHGRLRDLDANLALLSRQGDLASAQLEMRDTEIEHLTSSVAAAESERATMRKAYEDAEAQSLDLQKRLAAAQSELTQVSASLEEAKATNIRLADLAEQAERRNEENDAMREAFADLKARHETALAEVTRGHALLAQQEKQVDTLQRQLDSVSGQLDDVRRTGAARADLLADAQLALGSLWTTRAATLGRTAQLMDALATADGRAEASTTRHEEIAEELATSTQKIEELQRTLAARTEASDAMQREIAGLRRQFADTEGLLSDIRRNADALASRNDQLRQTLTQNESAAQVELDELRSQLASSQQALSQQQTAMVSETKKLAASEQALQAERARAAALDRQRRTFEERLQASDIELSAYRSIEKHLAFTLTQISDLQRVADERQRQSEALVADLDKLQAIDEQRQQQIQALRDENRAKSRALSAAQSRLRDRKTNLPQPTEAETIASRDPADSDMRQILTAPATAAGRAAAPKSAVNGSATRIQGENTAGQRDSGAIKQVERFVQSWARDWSNQDVDGYLAHYSDAFRPDDGISRLDWALNRRSRISAPSRIRVAIEDIRVKLVGASVAEAAFEQHYEADHYQDQVNKSLALRREHGDWKIVRESTN